jgi:peptide/nickel transport system substrate-binding protein
MDQGSVYNVGFSDYGQHQVKQQEGVRETMRYRFSSAVARALAVAVLVGLVAVPATATAAARPSASAKYLVAFQSEPTSGWVSRNFNPFAAAPDDFTLGAIYEPLEVITQAGGGKTYPWLATGFKWARGNKALTLKLRHGVRWSDGKPFTSADVVFTFQYGKAHNVDKTGLMTSGQITSVKAAGKYAVRFTFRSVDTTLLQSLLSNAVIIPKHIWSKISNPVTYVNSHPVGTGPFTQVKNFTNQQYTLGRNPHYWQPLHYAGIKVPAFSSNDSALAAMVQGQVDWAPVYVQDAASAWVAAAPKYNHYFYSPPTTPLDLMFNDQQYPYSLPVFRQAISMSINRTELSQKAENGYEKPADALGIRFLYPGWVDKSLQGRDKTLSTYNPKAALKMLKKAHFSDKGGQLYDPRGNKVQMGLTCPAGWSDWQTQLQIMQQNLAHIGIHVQVSFIDQNTWFGNRSSRTMGGKFYGLFGTESSGQTPYQYFWSFMSKESYFPVNGQLPGDSWNIEGWYNHQATVLLDKFRQTSKSSVQHSIVNTLQKIDLQNLPVITTVTQAQWYDWSTRHFTGFPTAKNYYAYGTAYTYPDDVKILTTLRPH